MGVIFHVFLIVGVSLYLLPTTPSPSCIEISEKFSWHVLLVHVIGYLKKLNNGIWVVWPLPDLSQKNINSVYCNDRPNWIGRIWKTDQTKFIKIYRFTNPQYLVSLLACLCTFPKYSTCYILTEVSHILTEVSHNFVNFIFVKSDAVTALRQDWNIVDLPLKKKSHIAKRVVVELTSDKKQKKLINKILCFCFGIWHFFFLLLFQKRVYKSVEEIHLVLKKR